MLMNLAGKKILLGVSGGIAAYKSCELLRLLQKKGAEVRVCMTEAATQFVAPLTFASLSKCPVYLKNGAVEARPFQHIDFRVGRTFIWLVRRPQLSLESLSMA